MLTSHFKHWLRNSHRQYLHLTIKQIGDTDNVRFATSMNNPQLLVVQKTNNPHQSWTISELRVKRDNLDDIDDGPTRICAGAQDRDCCQRRMRVNLREFLSYLPQSITNVPDDNIEVRICNEIGICYPSTAQSCYHKGLTDILISISKQKTP